MILEIPEKQVLIEVLYKKPEGNKKAVWGSFQTVQAALPINAKFEKVWEKVVSFQMDKTLKDDRGVVVAFAEQPPEKQHRLVMSTIRKTLDRYLKEQEKERIDDDSE